MREDIATKRMRELLDERGVEHTDTRLSTLWLYDEEGYLACVDEGDSTLVHLHWWCTPEQAIEATLGAAKEPPTAVKVTLPSEWNACELIPWVDVTMPNGDVTHLVPDATLGRGECHDKGNIEQFICSECGCHLDMQDDDCEPTMWLDGEAMAPRFCPNCGKRVKDVK